LSNILFLLINIQISILPTRPPEKNYRAGLLETARYPPDFCGKNGNRPNLKSHTHHSTKELLIVLIKT